jgi:hypothetical protein
MYVNDFPPTKNAISKLVLFAGNDSIIILELNQVSCVKLSNSIISLMNKWFMADKLTLNTD